MNLTKTMCLLLAYVAASSLYGNAVEWEGLMREHRPRLPAKETRSLPTLRAAAAVRNGNGDEAAVAIRAAAKRALGAALPDTAVFENAFRTDEERIDVAAFTSGGVRNRIAVYGQLGNFEPYYRIVDGLAASAPSGMADFLARNCVVGGNACVSAVDGVLAADEVVIRGGRGETLSAPYARFYFVFVDDKPGANWAHPCRYVFISEDCTSFTILYKLWRPRLSVKATGERIGLQAVGEEPEINATSLEKIRESVYNYAAGLERNSLSYATGDKSKAYFVLISGGDDPASNGIRFWSDTAMFYSTLTKKYGVDKDHIKVYVSDGNSTGADANLASTDGKTTPVLVDSPKDLDGDGDGDITGAATKANVKACFDSLKSTLTANDQLFVFITSHGGPDGPAAPSNYDSYAMLFDGSGEGNEWLDDNELADYTSELPCPVAFAIETCYSGGFIDDVTATAHRVIATACNHYESSFGYVGGGEWADGNIGKTSACNTWAHPFIAAFRGSYVATWMYAGGYPWTDYTGLAVDSDTDGNGLVSFNEARLWAAQKDPKRCTLSSHPAWCSYNYQNGQPVVNEYEHPQYGESPSGFGASFFMLKQTGSVSSGPANDNFASATTISGSSGSLSGSNVGATMETGETKPSTQSSSTGSVWYKWTAPASGNVTFDTIGSGFDTVLGVYTGTAVSSLAEVKSDDDSGDSTARTSKLTFPAVSGTTYRIAVYGYNGKNGQFKLNWNLLATESAYTVTFNATGGSVSPATRTVSGGATVGTLPTPTQTGYDFLGWFTAKSGGTQVTASTKVTANVTFYAHWQANTLTVTFNPTNGSVSPKSKSVQYNKPYGTLPTPTQAGYRFLGWFTERSGGTQVKGTTTMKRSVDHTLYAHWKKSGWPAIETGGRTPSWAQQADGSWQSGAISDFQTNWIQTTVSGPGAISFKWMVSSESSYDKFVFSIDGVRILEKSGTGVTTFTDASFGITGSGTHVLRWAYEKDINGKAGSDCAWVSQIKWTATASASVTMASNARETGPTSGAFAPGEMLGVFADGEGTFALQLDEGMETAYLVTWTADGDVSCECEAEALDDTLVLTTEDGVVYRLTWSGGSLVATRVD